MPVRLVDRRTRCAPGPRIHVYGAMERTQLDRRFARYEPRAREYRTLRIGQITRGGAHIDPPQIRRLPECRFAKSGLVRNDRVDNLEKERGCRSHAYKRRVAHTVKIADPDDQHVGAENT